jgi:hypothetical protein
VGTLTAKNIVFVKLPVPIGRVRVSKVKLHPQIARVRVGSKIPSRPT